jgi:hypothetical protein
MPNGMVQERCNFGAPGLNYNRISIFDFVLASAHELTGIHVFTCIGGQNVSFASQSQEYFIFLIAVPKAVAIRGHQFTRTRDEGDS